VLVYTPVYFQMFFGIWHSEGRAWTGMGRGPVDTTVQVHSLASKILMNYRAVSIMVHVHGSLDSHSYFNHTINVGSCQL